MQTIIDDHDDLPLEIVALCMDNRDLLDVYFEGAERPPFTVGFISWQTGKETQTVGVPQYFLLARDRTLLFHAESLEADEEERLLEILRQGESGAAEGD